MSLEAKLVPVNNISKSHIEAMFQLMQSYYENVRRDVFEQDLYRKNWAILLMNDGEIRGFSTQALFEHDTGNEILNVVFSGDTIIAKEYWGSFALPLTWGQMMLAILKKHPDKKLYWFLISKGFRTYKMVPIYFNEFYPCYNKETPGYEKNLIDQLALRMFSDAYDSEKGVIVASKDSQRLKLETGAISEQHLLDEHIAFFTRANPNHAAGDNLACVAQFTKENLSPFYIKRLNSNELGSVEL